MSELTQDRKFIARILENLPDMSNDVKQGWIDNPKGLKKVLAEVLCPPVAATKTEFGVWKTIKLGTHKTADDFRKAIKAAEMFIGDWANDVLGKPAFKASETETEVDLVNVSVEELGFKEGAKYKEICARAKELGLELCPAEVGPQLRLQYKDQPKGEWLVVAMEAMTASRCDLSVFNVERYGGGLQWLNGDSGEPDDSWDAGNRFVFVRRK